MIKIRDANIPYACVDWHGIQIPHAILSLLDQKWLRLIFFDDKIEGERHTFLFYEHNSAGRGLDFDDYLKEKPDFAWYAVELCCLNLDIDSKKTPLPPLENLVEAITIVLNLGLRRNKEPRKEPEKII